MPKFHVRLDVQVGEYEKTTHHNIDAPNRAAAMLQAMADESHGNAYVDDEGRWWDLGGEMAYKVSGCEDITDDVSETLNTVGIWSSSFSEEQILDMIDEDAEVRDIDVLLGYLT